MPRTKRRTTKRSVADLSMNSNMTMANQPKNIKEILFEFENEKQVIEGFFSEKFDAFQNVVENTFLMVKMNFSGSLDTNLYEYLSTVVTSNTNTTNTNRAERPTRPVTKTTGIRSSRQKSACSAAKTNSSATVVKQRRNASEDRPPLTEKFVTPVNRPPMPLSATVTPKVNMNEPISMMRRPNQGEMALSMTGSPLMVSAVSRDNMATISVPLANGNVVSILPKVGVSMDISFNEQTKNELLLLKGNIEDLLKMNRGL